jgi:hypothetical protein
MVSSLMANLQRERERERGTYTSDDVGIDNRDAMGLEEIGDGALSRSDSTS